MRILPVNILQRARTTTWPRRKMIIGCLQYRNNSNKRLPSEQQSRQNDITKSISKAMDRFTESVFIASQRINDLTGYSEIEKLKKGIQLKEQQVEKLRLNVKERKELYQDCIKNRSAQQRELSELLHRKHAWTPVDLERFTKLYKDQQENEIKENSLNGELESCQDEFDDAQTDLSKLILTRYHEEQIWSDKIRQVSTWGTWMLMGINVFLFVIVQLGLEPWKRKRLVNSFQQVVATRFDSQMDDIKQLSDSAARSATTSTVNEPLSEPVPTSPTVIEDDEKQEQTLVQEQDSSNQDITQHSWSTFPDRLRLLFHHYHKNDDEIIAKPFFTRDEITLVGITSALFGSFFTMTLALLLRGS